jgi:hypothetical protein
MYNIQNCIIKGIVVNKEYLGGPEHIGKNDFGIILIGKYNDINLNIYTEKIGNGATNTKFYKKMYDINKDITNLIIINGSNVNKENYYNEMYIADNNGVADDFTKESFGTAITSCSIDYDERAQKIEMSDTSSGSINNYIKLIKQITIPTGISIFSLMCDRKETNETNNCPLRFRVRCYDENNTQLSSVEYSSTQSNFIGNSLSKTKWNIFSANYNIHENTSYIKLEILLTLNAVNAINTALIKNLKYKLY